jgi:hypothetical protein
MKVFSTLLVSAAIAIAPVSAGLAASFKPAVKASSNQGGGPGKSGTGDKASSKTGQPGPGNWGPGVGNANPGQSKQIP